MLSNLIRVVRLIQPLLYAMKLALFEKISYLFENISCLEERIELKVHILNAGSNLHHLLEFLECLVEFKEVASFPELAVDHQDYVLHVIQP